MRGAAARQRSDRPGTKRTILLRASFLSAAALAAVLACVERGDDLAGADDLAPRHSVRLDITATRSDTGERIPARIYLSKGGRPFRLSPVDTLLPLHPDLFYRERVWRRSSESSVLEVTARGESHFVLLDGTGSFDLPAAPDYRIEAYHGTFFRPAAAEFALQFGEDSHIEVALDPVAPGIQDQWLAGDGHIHLMRAREDDSLFLRWMQAEQLAVANFLELQRQQHAAMQWGFGERAEARAAGHSIRSGHESRSRFYGHTLFLGPDRMVLPLSVGLEYANQALAFPHPMVLFQRGRELGALTGFAHLYGSQPNSTLLMNLAHGTIDFVEVFQFGVLKTDEWYELLNAGFRVVGLAGSDFPANLSRFPAWPRALPLLGPERALVQADPGESAYQAWEDGVRAGRVLLTNGPLLEFAAGGSRAGATVEWAGESHVVRCVAKAYYFRPITSLEIILNGEVVARADGGGDAERLSMDASIELRESGWLAARATATTLEGEPPILAHTNPVYFHREGRRVRVESARKALRERWRVEAGHYRSSGLTFPDAESFESFLAGVERTTRALAD